MEQEVKVQTGSAMDIVRQEAASARVAAGEVWSAGVETQLLGLRQNWLIRALETLGIDDVLPRFELLELPVGEHLCHFGDDSGYAYFPTNAVISLLYIREDGATTEIAVVGREGVVGFDMLDNEPAPSTAVVQCRGYAYRLPADLLRRACRAHPAAMELMMKYRSALLAQMSQNVVSGLHCSIMQRLARWLLDRLDRLSSAEIAVTHDLIAASLGARRESITANLLKLQGQDIVACRRGRIAVLDRAQLETIAGGCYRAGRIAYDALFEVPLS
jgi:CRP-like cAMP-binding protein